MPAPRGMALNPAVWAGLTGLPIHVIGGVGGSLYDFRTTAPTFWPSLEQLA